MIDLGALRAELLAECENASAPALARVVRDGGTAGEIFEVLRMELEDFFPAEGQVQVYENPQVWAALAARLGFLSGAFAVLGSESVDVDAFVADPDWYDEIEGVDADPGEEVEVPDRGDGGASLLPILEGLVYGLMAGFLLGVWAGTTAILGFLWLLVML